MLSVKICGTSAGLASIKEVATELVIWQRSLPSGFQKWIEQLDSADLPDIRILIKPHDLRRALELPLNNSGLRAHNRMRDRLVEDIGNLVAIFAFITQSDDVDVRLQRVSNDACWKFHRDFVETRLVTTYRGPTTEWVRHTHAEKAIQEQRHFKGPLEHLGNGDVAIFKGSSTSPNKGVVHRSPPIAGTGLTRLLLCLNQRTPTSPDPWVEA
jgi:hypothetical protein